MAGQLLSRHGVLVRDAAGFEGVPGGFAALYPVLAALEDQGKIRRGYFVTGLGGSQFAEPGALERLRALRDPGEEPSGVVLAAADPANPYGAVLPWPRTEAGLARVAGAHVVLVDGALAAYLSREARQLTLFLPAAEPARGAVARAAARALAAWMDRVGGASIGWGGMQDEDRDSLAPCLLAAGFQRSGPGFRYVGKDSGQKAEAVTGEIPPGPL